MRTGAYHLFEIVAWPALAWCAIEVVLRTATRSPDGLFATGATGLMAGLTVVACRARARQLAGAGARD